MAAHVDTAACAVFREQNAGYLCSLLEVFGDLEDFEMEAELQTLFKIMRTIRAWHTRSRRACSADAHTPPQLLPPVCLNSLDIFQVVLSDELFAAFAGVMECAWAATSTACCVSKVPRLRATPLMLSCVCVLVSHR